jgi:protein SCO1/2
MTKYSTVKKVAGLLGILLLFPLTFILVFNSMEHRFDSLPYFGDKKVINSASGSSDTLYYKVPDYELIDQNGEAFSSDSLDGKVYLAAFFNTGSPYIAKITKRLLHANFRYRNEADIAIVCFSTNPELDTPEQLKSYTSELRVDEDKFFFLSSPDSSVIDVITDNFLVDDYKNSSRIWLVDARGHLRGKYDGNKEKEIQRATEDIALLKKEMDIERYQERKRKENEVED